jgi:hypothetical protein
MFVDLAFISIPQDGSFVFKHYLILNVLFFVPLPIPESHTIEQHNTFGTRRTI